MFYTLLIYALLPWAVLHLLWRARRQPAYLRHWPERFALYARNSAKTHPLIWLHAVSVGETRAAQPLVAALRARYPQHRILLTHMTPTGRETSLTLFGGSVERAYLPYDTPAAVRRFLRHHQPAIGLIIETELWPNLIAACQQRAVPLLLVNARLSARSARRYAFFPRLTREALQSLGAISCIGADDAHHLQSLGAREAQMQVMGNLKFDIEPPAAALQLGAAFRQRVGPRPVFLCASTRAGEEALLLDAWKTHPQRGELLLVLVPRHPQRFVEVEALAKAQGFTVERRSTGGSINANTDIWLGDSMGEMFAYYRLANLAFIGGSLLDYGSQNLIEACAAGAPVLLGPSVFNFPDAARAALACGAARQIKTADELVATALKLTPADLAAMSAAGRAFAANHQGATARNLALIERFIEG